MDLSIPGSDFQSPSITSFTPVFGDNVQDLLNVGTLHVSASSIITVNSIVDVVDDNDCITTLREAINFANADELEDLIVFERSLFDNEQTVELSLGQLDITHSLTIIAPRNKFTGANLLTVSGNNASRVFEIGEGVTVNLSGLIIADGRAGNDDGGGIKNSGTLTLDSSIVRNHSARNGGGIANSSGAILTVSNSTISSNLAGTNNGYGGGIYNIFGSILRVSNSTFTNNSTTGQGGGIYNSNSSTVEVSNSTFSNNNSVRNGGGIYNDTSATLEVSNSTLSLNQAANGGGVFNGVGRSATVRNTIIAANLPSTDGVNPDLAGNFTSLGYNLIGNSTGSSGFGVTGDIVGTSNSPIDPLLGLLDFNGGSTQTQALLPGSPAIDAGDPTLLADDPTTDQRGFPRVIGARADIGAFELS